MRRVLYRVVHGSHLYGTAHAGSDRDVYEVVEGVPARNIWTSKRGYSRQGTDADGSDVTRKDLSTWARELADGVPQACEAAWAADRFVEVDLLREFRLSYRLGTAGWSRHRRAMRNFACGHWDGGHKGDYEAYAFKRAKHAVRVAWNLRGLRERGWYDPTLRPDQVLVLETVARNLGIGTELLETCDAIALGDTIK